PSTIIRTNSFQQLRLLMKHDPIMRLDAKVIERLTRLPVLQIDSARNSSSTGFKPYKIGTKWLQVKSLLPPRVLQQILSTTWATGMLPEPLRIAHLVA